VLDQRKAIPWLITHKEFDASISEMGKSERESKILKACLFGILYCLF